MPENILYMQEKLKSFFATDAYFYSFLLVLVALVSFGLGKQSVLPEKATPNTFPAVSTEPHRLVPNREVLAAEASATAASGSVIASKSGSKYHLPSCPGAKQIKESNKITFDSIAAAEAAGYTPAANCNF